MKKWIKNVIITTIILAIICAGLWKIGWISSWKEVAGLYGILVVVIGVGIAGLIISIIDDAKK